MTRLANLALGAPRRVLLVAVLLFLAAGAFGGSVAKHLDPYGADDAATETYAARTAIERASGLEAKPGVIALVATPTGARSPAGRARVARVVATLRREPTVGRVVSTLDRPDPALIARDGRSTYVAAVMRAVGEHRLDGAAPQIQRRLDALPGVRAGGRLLASHELNHIVESDLQHAEMLAFPLLFVLSLLFFRSLVAALLPLLVGMLAIVGTFAGLRVASEVGSVSIFALNLTTGLGLGLAIDYSLFIVSRYREELAASGDPPQALRRTLATSGRTVLFSSLTVAAALASLLVFPQRFLYSMGLGGTMVALIASVVALVVLPAVLALLGPRVNAGAPRWLTRRAERDARPDEAGAWYRLSRFVMRRPGRVAIASAALLIALGIPFLSISFTSVDASVLPKSSPQRQVGDAIAAGFPAGRDEPVVAVTSTSRAVALRPRIARVPGVEAVSPPQPVGHGLATLAAYSRAPSYSRRAQDMVRDVRALPGVRVTGTTADFVDTRASIARHLPLALVIVAGTTLVVLFLMTGSLVLPLKALVMNLLTLSAAFGLLVLIFQDGRLEGVLDYTSQGALELTQPVLLFALAFGLSTDYGVFLLGRIKEARDHGASDREAVAVGLERTGRIVTAAALLFCVAIGAFATSRIVFIKELGVGTALAVLVDATIVRALLVPALMELLGRRNWWAPRQLRRLHDRIGLREGDAPGARVAA
ncbi:MAG: putative drug exporter of the superfamily [Solirubrobacteraceae bacterium]|nr:putative drug exporter of the superfamily [Solirubrobacteraceae bacterium]